MLINVGLKFNSNYTLGNKVERLVIHHSGVTVEQDINVIHNYHKSLGWAGIGYHIYIRKNGKAYQGRPFEMVGCHASGGNYNSLGICFEGDFDREGMSQEQMTTGIQVISWLKKKFNLTKADIFPHSYFGGTTCPSNGFPFKEIIGSFSVVGGEENMIQYIDEHQVRYGSKGWHVSMCQSIFYMIGYDPNGVDTHCGEGMDKCIRKFQADNGLKVDGWIGRNTIERMLSKL